MFKFKDESKLLIYTTMLQLIIFFNLCLLKKPIEYKALIIGGILCFLMLYGYFIIRKFFKKGDKYILIFSNILSSIGIATIYRLYEDEAIKQILWYVFGMGIFTISILILPRLKKIKKYKTQFLIVTLILMSISMLFGQETFGAKNWIFIGSFGFQPSEFGKIFLILYLSSAFCDYEKPKDLLIPGIVTMVCLMCLMVQKDLGMALICFGIALTMLFIATSNYIYVFLCTSFFAGGAFLSYKLFSHIQVRFLVWRDPFKYAYDEGYQIVQSLYAIASGGFMGSGLGKGYPQFIPVNDRDLIFAVICEEFGVLVGFAIIIIYFLLFYRAIRAALTTKDKFLKLIAVGFSTMIACQVLVIIGGTINMIPLTGVTLPLISYGGSSMLTTFMALGVLQKISEGE